MLALGCDWRAREAATSVSVTPTSIRADRRYYDGAPPIIPHVPMPGACTGCHTPSGRSLPGLGIAPANPHTRTDGIGSAAMCRQCHVFRATDSVFGGSRFASMKQDLRAGERASPGAPPVIPHALFLREDCVACHAGIAARPEITFDHAERVNCLQCHLRQATTAELPRSSETAIASQ
jgi:cytochrome c-type protein NapB